MNSVEIIILIVIVLLALFFILPSIMNYGAPAERFDSVYNGMEMKKIANVYEQGSSGQNNQLSNQILNQMNNESYNQSEMSSDACPGNRMHPGPKTQIQDELKAVFVPQRNSQAMLDPDNVSGYDPDDSMDGSLVPRGPNKNYESLIFDDVTRSIMTGSQFMDNTGLVTPPWVAPAWDPDAFGPSSKGEIDPADYDNDPRMLYNKCSLSCCSPQYPTPFQGDADPFVCDKNGNNKYLASNYVCQNNTGGTGCLCMTPKQVDGMYNGWVDYNVDQANLGY